MNSEILILVCFFACWGSFLNVVAYRLIRRQSLFLPRSYCPHCRRTVAWYDNIPLISWILLQGRCRWCRKPISYLYPFIELLSVVLFTLLWISPVSDYFLGYFIFISALVVTIRTDLESMLVSRFVTLYLAPIGALLAYLQLLPLSASQSILGSSVGYGMLALIAYLFEYATGREGMGQGDLDLLACIGGFIGPMGCWFTLLIASVSGAILGIIYLHTTKQARTTKIPFGPFLAVGALIYIFWQEEILYFFF